MPGDRSESVNTPQPESQSSGFFGHAFQSIKHGAAVVRDTTVGAVKHGVAKGEEMAHSPGAHKLEGQVVDAGKQALHKGHEIVQSPTTQRIAGQVFVAGKEVAQDHVNRVNGVIDAGKRGDIRSVVQQGLPLAGEAMLGPAGAATLIAKEKGGQILLQNVPPEQRDTLRRLQAGTNLATAKPSHLPHLIIEGADSASKK